MNPELVPDYLSQDYENRTTYSRLSEVGVSEVEHQIRAILPERHEAGLLAIAPYESCLLLLRRAWTGRSLLAYSRFVSAGTRYSLDNRFILAS